MGRREVVTCDCCGEEGSCEQYPLKGCNYLNGYSLCLASPHQKSMLDLCIPCARMINDVIAEAVDKIKSTRKDKGGVV